VEVDREDLGDERAAADARSAIEQLAQARVLGLERGEPLQAQPRVQLIALEPFVLGDERLAGREVFAHVRPAAKRQIDEQAPRLDDDGQSATHAFDVLIAMIEDRKSTRLNSSHLGISYAVFCLK